MNDQIQIENMQTVAMTLLRIFLYSITSSELLAD
jgi:hypothetical protein